MAPIRQFDEDTMREMLAMLADWRQRRTIETVSRSIRPVPDPQAPEVYVARAPEGGIPGIDENTTGTGSPGWQDDIPGSAVCEIYKLSPVNDVYTLKRTGFYKTVYNLGAAVDGQALVSAVRDKWGKWWAVPAPAAVADSAGTGTQGIYSTVYYVLNSLTYSPTVDTWETLGLITLSSGVSNTAVSITDSGESFTITAPTGNSIFSISLNVKNQSDIYSPSGVFYIRMRVVPDGTANIICEAMADASSIGSDYYAWAQSMYGIVFFTGSSTNKFRVQIYHTCADVSPIIDGRLLISRLR